MSKNPSKRPSSDPFFSLLVNNNDKLSLQRLPSGNSF
jgi:hypothetical protein